MSCDKFAGEHTSDCFVFVRIFRCTLINNCPSNFWQQDSQQCTHIVHVQPLKASVDYSQWVCLIKNAFEYTCHVFLSLKINLTLSKLSQLEHNEIYQCIFGDKIMSAYTQAIKLDHNRLSCPTPSNQNLQLHIGKILDHLTHAIALGMKCQLT